MRQPKMAVMAGFTLIQLLTPAVFVLTDGDQNNKVIDCTNKTGVQAVTVAKKGTTVEIKCGSANVKPAFTEGTGTAFKVCPTQDCQSPDAIGTVCKGSEGQKGSGNTATITVNSLPKDTTEFYINCDTTKTLPNGCIAKVIVEGAPEPGVGGVAGVGGAAPTETCSGEGQSITIKVPETGPSKPFACGSSMKLFPTEPNKIFKDDCKNREDLKDITRNDADNAYTLTATKKPPKKRQCYLCAKLTIIDKPPGQPSDYCAIYVESSARTHFLSGLRLALALPSVLVLVHFT